MTLYPNLSPCHSWTHNYVNDTFHFITKQFTIDQFGSLVLSNVLSQVYVASMMKWQFLAVKNLKKLETKVHIEQYQ